MYSAKVHISFLLISILPLTTWEANVASSVDLEHRLEPKSTVVLADEEELRSSRLWQPPYDLAHWPDNWITRHYPLPEFTNSALVSDKRPFDADFSWTSVSLLSLPLYNLSYVLLGGSWARYKDSPYPREDGIVRLCNFTLSATGQLEISTPCQDLLTGVNSTDFMGAASSSMKISENMGLIAYCDPLWRGDSYFPAGRCYLQLLHNKHIRPRHELSSFCQTGGKVTEPCMTGFSVDLHSKARDSSSFMDVVKGVHLIVGQPLASRFGKAQIIVDPFYSPRIYTVYRPPVLKESLPESYFGYSVAGDYVSVVSDGFERKSSHIENQTELTQIFKVNSALGSGEAGAVDIDWQGQLDTTGSFAGFGTSMVRLANIGGKDAIIVGAPYSPDGGRIYLFCVLPNFAMRMGNNGIPTDRYNDYLFMPQNMGAFGFALSVVGDLDGDGIDDIAVGSPQLSDQTNPGNVFLLRITRNCTFDRQPLQQIDGPAGGAYFGSVLPRRGEDLDFNGWPDLALTTPFCDSCSPMVFASRPRFRAVCRFAQPSWLGSARVYRNKRIPIKIKVQLIPLTKRGQQSFAEVLRAAHISHNDLLHQINPDLWAKEPSEQRVRLEALKGVKLDANNVLTLHMNVLPRMNVEDMPSLEQPDGAVRIQYRFNFPCPQDSPQSSESKTCINGAWVHRPIIDWKDCNFHLRLSKYVCFPEGKCESDVSLRVTDDKSRITVNSTDQSPQGETSLIYGDKEGSMHTLTIDVSNQGPTFAGGTWINFIYTGNLHFSAYEIGLPEGNGSLTFKPSVCSHPQNNDTWVACKLGRLEAPWGNLSKNIQTIQLTSFYAGNDGVKPTDFSIDSFVNVSVLSQTYDPTPLLNSVRWNYRLLHAPKYLVSIGAQAPSSVVDNRTRPPSLIPGFHHRIRLEEMGPKLHHTFQLEHIGLSKSVVNVTVRIQVPVGLKISSDYLVYLFNEIRALKRSGTGLEWVSLRPIVKVQGGARDQEHVGSRCWYSDESLVNPNGWIGIDMSKSQLIRSRRDANEISGFNADTAEADPTLFLEKLNESALEEATGGRHGNRGRRSRVVFRRVPKEVIQCGRVGHKFGKPVCVEIVCRLSELLQNRPVQISVTGWLYTPTFFEHSTSDIEVVTTLLADQGAVPKGVMRSPEPISTFDIPQVFFFPQLKPALLCQIPIWPIIVGLVLGILLLALIIIVLYRYGFFQRRKHKLAVSGHRRWHENLDATDSNQTADTVDGGANGAVGAFGSVRSAEEARKRRLKLRKHPEDVNITHPDEVSKDNAAAISSDGLLEDLHGQDNPTETAPLTHPTIAKNNA